MQKDCTVFSIPDSAQPEPVLLDEEVSDIYTELNSIAEELEECRLRNC